MVTIRYYDDNNNLLGDEIDESGLSRSELEAWLSDSNLEQSGPDGWTQFEIVEG